MDELLTAIRDFRYAFVVAVGEKSPFAKEALRRIDSAVNRAVGDYCSCVWKGDIDIVDGVILCASCHRPRR